MKTAQILRKKIDSGKLTLGILVTFHLWLDLIEIARDAGLDYVIVDLEHNDFGSDKVSEVCAVGRMIDFPILIRPAETEYTHIRLAADVGACGFLLPSVRNAGMLDVARDALYMPPRGRRRPGGPGNQWVTDYNYHTWRDSVENDFIVLPQIEDTVGLGNVEAIVRHELTTAAAIGPYDLSASLGVCWEPTHPEFMAAIDTIHTKAREAGRKTWMIGDAATLAAQGFSLICMGQPVPMFKAMLKSAVSAARTDNARGSVSNVLS